ncbi:hypothetical protein MBANPS3_001427 [Mucor bainieri]
MNHCQQSHFASFNRQYDYITNENGRLGSKYRSVYNDFISQLHDPSRFNAGEYAQICGGFLHDANSVREYCLWCLDQLPEEDTRPSVDYQSVVERALWKAFIALLKAQLDAVGLMRGELWNPHEAPVSEANQQVTKKQDTVVKWLASGYSLIHKDRFKPVEPIPWKEPPKKKKEPKNLKAKIDPGHQRIRNSQQQEPRNSRRSEADQSSDQSSLQPSDFTSTLYDDEYPSAENAGEYNACEGGEEYPCRYQGTDEGPSSVIPAIKSMQISRATRSSSSPFSSSENSTERQNQPDDSHYPSSNINATKAQEKQPMSTTRVITKRRSITKIFLTRSTSTETTESRGQSKQARTDNVAATLLQTDMVTTTVEPTAGKPSDTRSKGKQPDRMSSDHLPKDTIRRPIPPPSIIEPSKPSTPSIVNTQSARAVTQPSVTTVNKQTPRTVKTQTSRSVNTRTPIHTVNTTSTINGATRESARNTTTQTSTSRNTRTTNTTTNTTTSTYSTTLNRTRYYDKE